MKKLTDLAIEVKDEHDEIESIEAFKALINDKEYYVALIEPGEQRTFIKDYIHRFKNIEKSMKNFMLKKCDERIAQANKRILDIETKIKEGTISEIMEDSKTPKKDKLNFFKKIFEMRFLLTRGEHMIQNPEVPNEIIVDCQMKWLIDDKGKCMSNEIYSGQQLTINSLYVMDFDHILLRDKIMHVKIAGRIWERQINFGYFTYVSEKKIWEYILKEPLILRQLITYGFAFDNCAPLKEFKLYGDCVLERLI